MPSRKIVVTLGILGVLAGIAGWGFYSLATRLRADAQHVRRVYRAREQLAAVSSLANDAETAAQAYIQSGDNGRLGLYDRTVARLRRTQARLQDLLAEDVLQRERAVQLEKLIAVLLADLQHGIDARQREGAAAASAPSRKRDDRSLDEVRSLVGVINRAERVRLWAAERRQRANAAQALIVTIGGIAAGFILLLPLSYRWARQAGERARFERALRDSEARFRALADSADDAILTADAEGRITYANNAAGHIFFYNPDHLVGQPITVLMPTRFQEAHRQGLQRFKTTGEGGLVGKATAIEGLRKGGQPFPIELSVRSWTSDDGPAFVAIVRDGSERRQTMAALRQSESRFRIVSELATDYAYSFRIAANGQPIGEWVTDAFERITGYSFAEVEARGGGITLVHPDDLPVVLQRLQRLFSNQPDTTEYRIITKDGATRWVRDRGLPVWDDEQQRVVCAYGAVQDITEQRQAQEQTQLRQEELAQVLRVATVGELSAGLAHEINQPLAAIVSYAKGCARRLRSGVVSPDDLLRVVEEIAAQAVRADEIVRRLRQLARKSSSRREPVDVNALVKNAVELTRHETRARRIEVDLDLTGDLPHVTGDGIALEQVMLNLLRNAFEAMSRSDAASARVVIRTGVDAPKSVVVSVSDLGEGFGSMDPERAFEPFFTMKSNGLGLGLSISRSIVEAHGGRLWAEPQSRGGVTMRFSLPVAE